MSQNGLRRFAMHSRDEQFDRTIATINDELKAADDARSLTFEPETVDPETVARRYLNQMIASPAVPVPSSVEAEEDSAEYRIIGTETVPLTGTKFVKFAQYYHRIPVYGSLVTVELDDDNSFLAISSAVGEPTEVDPVATISPAQAVAVIRDDAGTEPPAEPPRLYYYFDERTEPNKWRLVYIAKDVLRAHSGEGSGAYGTTVGMPEFADYVIDAHSGDVLARLSRTQPVTWSPGEASALDALGRQRAFRLESDDNGNLRLSDTVRNVRTHDFKFQDLTVLGHLLPGDFVVNPPDPWNAAAISAHANAAQVADFLLNVLRLNGLDNRGGPFMSSINCTYEPNDPERKVWKNAAWVGTQMVYGQRVVNGSLRSYALASDVVAHEIIHGLTGNTARLKYELESGALNESYSDIFGIIISNFHEPDVARWNWELGEDLNVTGVPLRDLSDPAKRGQPAHMNDFKRLSPGEVPHPRENDSGWVHVNSGIHNKAAHNLLTAENPDGSFRFTPREVSVLFALALTQYLSRTSVFSDSRSAVELAAQTLHRADPPETRAAKLVAIGRAFDAVGIAAPPA